MNIVSFFDLITKLHVKSNMYIIHDASLPKMFTVIVIINLSQLGICIIMMPIFITRSIVMLNILSPGIIIVYLFVRVRML